MKNRLLQMENLKIFELSPTSILKLLKDLYLAYSCEGQNSSTSNISQKNLLTFLHDLALPSQLLPGPSLDLLIISAKRKEKHITFEVFLEILKKASKAAYPDLLEASDTVYYFLDKHVLPLYNTISLEIEPLSLDEQALDVLHKITPMLSNLYKSEFSFEVFNTFDTEKIYKNSQRTMKRLILQLKIAPDLISHVKCAKIWKMLIGNSESLYTFEIQGEDFGTVFNFKRFLMYLLYCCSESSVKRGEMLYLRILAFFEHIEAWVNQQSRGGFELLKAPEVVGMIQDAHKDGNLENKEESSTLSLDHIRVSGVVDEIEAVFRIYSIWNAKSKRNYINLQKFVAMAMDCGAIRKSCVKKREIELIFVQSAVASGKRQQNTLNFSQFCKAIELVSMKIYQNTDSSQALERFTREFLSKLTENSFEVDIKSVNDLIKDSNLQEPLANLSKAVYPFTKFYMNEQLLMDFDNFFKFCSDFSIFPDLTGRVKLSQVFSTLAAGFAKNKMMLTGTRSLEKLLSAEDEYIEPEFINFDLFIDGIAICAIESLSINRTAAEKLTFAIEKISRSEGASKISLKSGSTRSGLLEKADRLCYLPSVASQTPLNFVQLLCNRTN